MSGRLDVTAVHEPGSSCCVACPVTRLVARYQDGIGAGGLGADGGGDLTAHVPLGQARHLDIVDTVARLRKLGSQSTQECRFSGARRSDEGFMLRKTYSANFSLIALKQRDGFIHAMFYVCFQRHVFVFGQLNIYRNTHAFVNDPIDRFIYFV